MWVNHEKHSLEIAPDALLIDLTLKGRMVRLGPWSQRRKGQQYRTSSWKR